MLVEDSYWGLSRKKKKWILVRGEARGKNYWVQLLVFLCILSLISNVTYQCNEGCCILLGSPADGFIPAPPLILSIVEGRLSHCAMWFTEDAGHLQEFDQPQRSLKAIRRLIQTGSIVACRFRREATQLVDSLLGHKILLSIEHIKGSSERPEKLSRWAWHFSSHVHRHPLFQMHFFDIFENAKKFETKMFCVDLHVVCVH
jgi:hypothetical protein